MKSSRRRPGIGRLGFCFPVIALACLPAAPASAGGNPGTFTYRAVITEFGTLGRHGGGVVSSVEVSTGVYQVVFATNIDACTIVGTVGRATKAGGTPWKPAFISAEALGANSNTVVVRTADMRGNPHQRAFHLLIACQVTG
ncbi:MAG TPA: hypothetical protein VLV55_00265 [Rhizomicrobium sp.]|nr:hypothetical protein [Rhizomicrobium sp.]